MKTLAAFQAIVRGLRARRLKAVDCRLLAGVRVLEGLAAAAVAVLPLPAARRILAKLQPLAAACRGPMREARVLWACDASARWPIGGSTCLARALAAELLLRPADGPLTLVIGVAAPAAGSLASHAWIERDGRVLVGGGDSARRFARLVAWDALS